ncbi:hypothetical protein PPYR_10911 [Photinus pyralis]|uniref:Uncharacterized protein n=1 Tax=Photinus pyralis TaxID=7054 RepID=A0A5N4AHK9_PHOPY|nr:hypothetical protein PPYR_10911 [Photinus pyralis]
MVSNFPMLFILTLVTVYMICILFVDVCDCAIVYLYHMCLTDALNPEENRIAPIQTTGEIMEEIDLIKPNTKGKLQHKSLVARHMVFRRKISCLRFFQPRN